MTGGEHAVICRRMILGMILGMCFALAPVAEAGAYKAYVSNEKGNTISVIDTSAWKVVETIKVGQRPRGIALTKDQKYVLVAVGDDDTIQMIDTTSNKVVDTLPSGPDPELFVDDPSGKILFFILSDLTTINTTFGGGRFLHTGLPDSGLAKPGKLILDFNRLENPPCAYTVYATCPLPPDQNRVPVPLEAGEKRYTPKESLTNP